MKRLYFITNNERIVCITTDEAKARRAVENLYDVYQTDVEEKRVKDVVGFADLKNVFKVGCAAGIRYRKVA